jgi:hypothetical protein
MSATETEYAYKSTNLEFMPVYSSLDKRNSAYLALINEGMNIDLTLENAVITSNGSIAEVNTGFHRIVPKPKDNKVSTAEHFNLDLLYPPYITTYTGNFNGFNPSINVLQRTATRTCENKQFIEILTPGTEQFNLYNEELQAWAAVSTYKEALSRLR